MQPTPLIGLDGRASHRGRDQRSAAVAGGGPDKGHVLAAVERGARLPGLEYRYYHKVAGAPRGVGWQENQAGNERDATTNLTMGFGFNGLLRRGAVAHLSRGHKCFILTKITVSNISHYLLSRCDEHTEMFIMMRT